MRDAAALAVVLLLAGGGAARAGNDCLVALEVDGATIARDAYGTRATCTDCDPACDHDGAAAANGACTFALRACVNRDGDPACPVAVVRRLRARPRRISVATPPLPSAAAPACAASWSTLDVPAGDSERLVLRARARNGQTRRRDVDRHTLACLSRPAGSPCPRPAGACGDGVIAPPEQCDPGAAPDGCAAGTICRSGGEHACECTPCAGPGPSSHTLVLTTLGGASSCAPPAEDAPSAGAVRAHDGMLLSRLAPGCFVAGGPFSTLRARLEAGARTALAVTAPLGCTAGRLPVGPSSAGGAFVAAGCSAPGCRFGAPWPVFNTALSSCIVARIAAPPAGNLDVDRGELSLDVPLALDVYLTTAEIHPCPVCIGGICRGGTVDGLACDADDPFSCPTGGTLLGTVPVTLALASAAATASAGGDGRFCPGQAAAGALGEPAGRLIEVAGFGTGAPLAPGVPGDLVLAGTFCVGTSGMPVLDATSGVPGPGALALPVRAQLD